MTEPSLRYDWTMNGRSVPGQEIFEFKDQSIGKYDIMVTVTAPSGTPLTHRWMAVVRGVQENDDIGLLWSPRVEVFGMKDIVTTADQPVLRQLAMCATWTKQERRQRGGMGASFVFRTGGGLPAESLSPLPSPLLLVKSVPLLV